jgi:hypothetical protein
MPSTVEELSAMAGDGSVNLSWKEPSDDGGRDIKHYVVLRGTSPSNMEEVKRVDDLTFLDETVSNGIAYHYTVYGVSEVGDGDMAGPVVVTPVGPPEVPQCLNVSSEDDVVMLTWSPPLFDGGSPVTGYVVLRREVGGNLTPIATLGDVTTYVDEDVRPGASYHYTVRAFNVAWEGESCPELEVRVPRAHVSEGNDWLPWVVLLVVVVIVVVLMLQLRGRRQTDQQGT